MSPSKAPLADRFFRALLRLLPEDFRGEFGDDMEETFRAQRNSTKVERGWVALLKMWWATIADIVRMAPREHVSVLAQDTRFAFRMMRSNAGYTLAAVLILGLGIGVNTSIFSVVNSVLLKPLPYAQGNQLVVLRQPETKAGIPDIGFSPKEVDDYRAQNHSFSGVVEYHAMTFTLLGGSEAHNVRTGVVSHDFFDFFGVKPVVGRTFLPEEEKPGAAPVLLLSYEFWKQAEHGDPNIIGKVYQMNDRPHTVIGVLPPIPQYPDENDVYMTTTSCPFRSSPATIANRGSRLVNLFGRLKPKTGLDMCRADLNVLSSRLQKDYPKDYRPDAGYHIAASLLREDLTADARPLLLTLLGAAAFVLLIACANVANLILARMARREQELVIRSAVGAGSGRLLRQLLTESLLMALLAAAVGMAFSAGSLKLLTQLAGQFSPRAREISIDGWVLGFTVVCASLTTVLFGSVAALYSRNDMASGLKDGARTSAERSRHVLRSLLIAAQVAFSFMLLIGAGLMIRSLERMQQVNPGFQPERVFAVQFNTNWSKYKDNATRLALVKRLTGNLQTVPGVLSQAISSDFPMNRTVASAGFNQTFQIEGKLSGDSVKSRSLASARSITVDYFRTLGIPLLSGRVFNDFDAPESEKVVVISGSLARNRWHNEDPVGRRITFDDGETWSRVVGVVGDVREFGPTQEAPEQIYHPIPQLTFARTVLVRATGDPEGITAAVRKAVHEAEPDMAIVKVETLEQARADTVSSPRTITRLFGIYAGLALVIAVIGIGSMLALWVRQRTREIGIRMALGASPGDILQKLVQQGMTLVVLGLIAGVAGAVMVTRFLKTLLFQVEPTDLATYLAVSALLLTAALAACYIPARRAARIDPQTAIRSE